MKIAFFGLPIAALLLAKDGHEIAYAAICRPGAIGTRRLKKRLGARAVVKPNVDADAVYDAVAREKPDLLVSWFWTTQLPARFLSIAPRGAIGVHPSLLPRHRGPDPFFWAIDAGDRETGVTAHLLEATYDTGAVLATKRLAIDPAWDAWDLARALDRPSLALLREVVRAYAEGRPPAAVPQDDAKATAAPAPGDDELEIRWSWTAERIVRRVRAAAPWPGAFTQIRGETVVVTRARRTADFPRVLEPGQAWVRKDGVAVVRAKDAAVELLEGWLDADDGEKTLTTPELAALVRSASAAP